MAHTAWQVLVRLSGVQAEILRGLLEANEIPVVLNQEGAGRAIGLGVGPLAEVEILVPESLLEQAQALWRAFQAGDLSTSG